MRLTKNKPEVALDICRLIAEGMSLNRAAKKHKIAHCTFLDWVRADDALAAAYTRATESRADLLFDELDEVVELAVGAETNVQVNALRLKADTIKWKLGKMSPRKYNDKIQQEVSGPEGGPIQAVVKVSFE